MFLDGNRLVFEPLVPEALLFVMAGLGAALVLFALFRRAPGGLLRLALMGAILAFLAGPTLVKEERRYHDDVAVVVIDRSISQESGDRTAQTDHARAAVEDAAGELDGLELRVVEAGPRAGGPPDGTMLVDAARRAMEGVPGDRLAGVVMITDGQVHDLPEEGDANLFGAPLHVLLTGEEDELDRRIEIASAPAFAIVGQQATAAIVVHDGSGASQFARVAIRRDGEPLETRLAPVGRETEIELPVGHGGRNIFEFVVEAGEGELTLENNRAAIAVNGVRDRLRVLLVSGEPYNGERTWRNLLKADPAVDLVHFTILRPPQKQDSTPIHELALIAFPIRELFEVKINEFDLIIFDRFWRRGVLHFAYLNNIVHYVREGGALLDAAGPSFAGPASLYRTPLSKVLPGAPTGEVTVTGFRPEVSEIGLRHPVTADLRGPLGDREWGRWFRLVDTEAAGADVLMTGPGDRPLLVLDRVGEGRVAQVLSDQAWLWARGYEGGGPQAEMLRRVAHWLMKEPALEEESVTAEIEGRQLTVKRRSLTPGPKTVTVTGPGGRARRLQLQEGNNGQSFARMDLDVAGLYRVRDGDLQSVAVLGNLNPLEFADLISTPEKLSPHVAASGGAMIRLADTPEPSLRRVGPGDRAAGRGWYGLVENEAYDVTGISRAPAVPPWVLVILMLGLALFAWRRESR
ncbi:hypothetical protein [Minwuia thermotolerans]|uniref:Glutamine amidotransferase domain-containing protein n=1 Tax=Minwuia thermotolerans TaxID=2056226 RepID=A0A2M9G6N6_9PROT|nr:hypothetical protein [Minwuia thermotolerans]PJK31385.1 hypothetical protein CVT23_01510 [Minwuia thermotolerans]